MGKSKKESTDNEEKGFYNPKDLAWWARSRPDGTNRNYGSTANFACLQRTKRRGVASRT